MARNDGVDRTTIRNQPRTESNIADAEAHNERQKACYRNEDIVPERSYLNIHFKEPSGSYQEMFQQLEHDGTISTRGLKQDAVHYGELVFDVNSAYFHNHSGYEFAQAFYTEAYRVAVEIVGGEQYILSNEKYKGDALLQKSYTVDFLTKKTKFNEGEIPQYYVEDNHEAIIDPKVFDMVQREMTKRGKGKKYHSSVHAFSSKIRCGECGSWYGSKVWHSNSQYRKTIWQCNHKFDGNKHYGTPHLTDEEIQRHFLSAANKLLATKDEVIANGREMQIFLFNTSDLEAEQAQLFEETQVVSDMVQQAIRENAHIALDQCEYQKRYESLVERFERAKTRLESVTTEIEEKQTASSCMDDFLTAFEQMPEVLTEFTLESWSSMVDYATVYSADDIRFTFKNGQEIKA